MNRLANLLSIRPGEGRLSSLLIGIMLLTAFGAALGMTGIEALFYARFGVDYLPYMYLGLGVTSMLTSFLITVALGRIPKALLYSAIPLLIAILLVGARLALFSKLSWLYPVLWLGKEILNSLINLVIWGLAGAVSDARQAKRLFPLFNASRILGQVIGGFATGALVNVLGTENLILVWAGSLVGTLLFSRLLLVQHPIQAEKASRRSRHRPTARLAEEVQRGFQYVRQSSLMTWISFSTIFFSILFFSLALPFTRAITERYPDEAALAGFLGLFNGLSTGAAFLTSLFLANRLFARFGIMLCILAFPVIYLIGFGSLALAPLFSVIVAFRFAQMLWLSGVADPAWQTMFNVVPTEKRDQVRAFIGGVPEQAGTFLSGGLLIIGEQALRPQQLYIIGLAAAAACTYMIYQARRGYQAALVEALRAGRPQIFFAEEQPFGGFRRDAAALETALAGLQDRSPLVRRTAADILGQLGLPAVHGPLVLQLADADPLVRAAVLKALAHTQATPALLDLAACLSDPEAEVRFEAVSALSALAADSPALSRLLVPLLDDPSTRVSTRAALALLKARDQRVGAELAAVQHRARQHLRTMAALGEYDERVHAIQAMGEWGDHEAFDFLSNELRDPLLEPAIQRVILTALARLDQQGALPILVTALKDRAVRHTAATLLGRCGPSVMGPVLDRLQETESVEGALQALEALPPPPASPILMFAQVAVARALNYDDLRRSLGFQQPPHPALRLLETSLQDVARENGLRAMRAIGLLGDRYAMNLAIENLRSPEPSRWANGLEALDALGARRKASLQPLIRLWESEGRAGGPIDWERLANDADPWIRDCARYAAHQLGVKPMEDAETLSVMDRILFFRQVPLFADLSPADLRQVAALAQEETYSDGEEIAHEGEPGDVMFVIVSGEVRVCTLTDGSEHEIARRGPGDYVGEMAILSREPRMASLVAVGDVRTLCLDHQNFEGLLRERPDVSLSVIRSLTQRLKEASLKRS